MSRIDYTISEEGNLLSTIVLIHPTASKNSLRKMIDSGRVLLDDEICRVAKSPVMRGQKITILPKKDGDPPRQLKRNLAKDPDILYEDQQIIVVSKPVGLLSVSTDSGNEKDTMHSRVFEWVKGKEKGRIFIVHRLDRETSGCMLFAKDIDTKEMLQEQFFNRSVERKYHAVLEGILQEKSGTCIDWIQQSKDLRVRIVPSANSKDSKEAITHWEIEEIVENRTLVCLSIETGRRAQIRLQMSALGAPVSGDTMYGKGRNSASRLCLHASSLRFIHPNGDEMKINSPLPSIFRRILKNG
jgi:23S rRNA pseudouridine1911/1915/1917 synthase